MTGDGNPEPDVEITLPPFVYLDKITDETSRDTLRRAAAAAQQGPVWITENGQHIAAIVSRDVAEHLPLADRLVGAIRQIVQEEIAAARSAETLSQVKYGGMM